jgi:hypothetical protein
VKGLLNFKAQVFGLIVLLFCLSHCREPRKKPANLLSQQEMVKTLIEIYIAEQKVSRLSLPQDSAAVVFDGLKSRVFNKLSVPDSVFKNSLDYYMTDPTQMEKIYAVLVDSLQLREQRTPQQTLPQ